MVTVLNAIARDLVVIVVAAYLLMFPVVWIGLFLAGFFGKDHDRRQP